MRFLINTPRNMAMVKSCLLSRSSLSSTVVGILPFDPIGPRELGQAAEPDLSEVQNRIGSAAVVVQVTGTNWPKPAYSLLVTGLCRIRVDQVVQETPFPIGMVEQIESLGPEGNFEISSPDLQTKMEEFKEKALILLELLDSSLPAVNRLKTMLATVPTQQLADMVSSIVKASYGERLDILNSLSIEERFEKAFPLLERQIEGLKITRNKLPKKKEGRKKKKEVPQRAMARKADHNGKQDWAEFEDDGSDDILELETSLKEAGLPPKALKAAAREFKRLKKMSPQMPEYPMLRHYLELVAELPWNKTSPESINIKKARADLDADHYSLDAVKKRILEYLAVRKLNPSLRGPILCFAGPPGVGKTSIAKSIASTLGREFHRISLGGVADQSDIRGHRRTYIGSMPGRLIQGIKSAGVKNPVFLLDEVDKMSAGIHGDPAAALLEVLDPEQNSNFNDHYLNVPFDLSQVLFIATANDLRNISRPLLDRMEIIPVSGYSFEDKLPIATRHLLPRQLGEHGLKDNDIEISETIINDIVSKYTREAGVRSLERKLGALCREVAVKLAEQKNTDNPEITCETDSKENMETTESVPEGPLMIDEKFIEKVLGQPIFDNSVGGRLGVPGVAVGMAWTSVGGETMIVEASRIPCSRGEGRLEVTGQLGSVMRESATLAMSWIRSHATPLGLDGAEIIANHDIHLHFPEGAVRKDGPSAGVTITTALVSLFTDRLVRDDLAMTGEISLRGLVLPVGGVRDKVLAAHRAGLDTIILPKKNMKDVQEIPEKIKEKMEFIGVETLEEVLHAAFPGGFPLILNEATFKKLSKL